MLIPKRNFARISRFARTNPLNNLCDERNFFEISIFEIIISVIKKKNFYTKERNYLLNWSSLLRLQSDNDKIGQ